MHCIMHFRILSENNSSCHIIFMKFSVDYTFFFFIVVVICIDESVDCNEWASRGECVNNPEYMLIGCRKTCHACGNS